MEPANPFKNNPFNLLRATSQDAVALQASAAYEHQAVLRTLKLTGLEPYRRDLLRAAAQHFGEARLTFLQFHAAFPDFPLRLACNNMKHLPKPLHLLQQVSAIKNLPAFGQFAAFHSERADRGAADQVSLRRDAGKLARVFGDQRKVAVHLVSLGEQEIEFDLHVAENAAEDLEKLPHPRRARGQTGRKVVIHKGRTDHLFNVRQAAHRLGIIPPDQGFVRF